MIQEEHFIDEPDAFYYKREIVDSTLLQYNGCKETIVICYKDILLYNLKKRLVTESIVLYILQMSWIELTDYHMIYGNIYNYKLLYLSNNTNIC